MILGIDEAGRGPWAGPLVVAAVVLPEETTLEHLNDSKQVTKKRREALEPLIRQQALGYGIGWVHADELDEIGMAAALRFATVRAVEQVTCRYTEIIIDGTINFLKETTKGTYVTTLPKADALIPAVSAASILAKVARDQYMTAQDTLYPAYGFAKHVGYGTAAHRQAIEQYGITPLHRLSFKPLVQYRKTPSLGEMAETVVARHLEAQGYTILERNWKRPMCEIDIIAERDSELFFIEVKHRTSDVFGGGMDAINTRKLRKLQLGVEAYRHEHSGYRDVPVHILVAATSGVSPKLDSLLEIFE